MSLIAPHLAHLPPFFLSGPLPCPYLPNRVERQLFTRLSSDDESENTRVNATLTRAGFRRSHDIVYRPACAGCQACVPIRVPVKTFKASRSQQRVLSRHRDFDFDLAPPAMTDALYDVFRLYQEARHPDSDMARLTKDEFASMLYSNRAVAHVYRLHRRGVVYGGIIVDAVQDGLSAVYSFFRPTEPSRSLGTLLVLRLLSEAAKEKLPYVYLGYWIAAARKMAYKSRFHPHEVLGPDGWVAKSAERPVF